MEKKVVIQGKDLSIGYRTGKKEKIVHQHLNFQLHSGELTCLLGANGAGKSTLLRTLSASQPSLSGELRMLDKLVSEYTEKERSRTIGVVLTDKTFTGGLSVYELVALGRQPHTGFFGRLQKEDKRIIEEAMEQVGIAHKARNYTAELSDGERQKVMIAKALVQECPLILLDEPTAFLDVVSRIEIMHLLHRLTIEQSKALGFIVHGVGMDYIHHHSNAKAMCVIHKCLELLRSTETRTESEEIGHLIAERSVIRMFLKSHYLESIIPEISNLRKDIESEFLECTHLLLLCGHSYMAFVNERMRTPAGPAVLPLIRLRIPHLGTELLCDRILHGSGRISRDSFRTAARPLDVQLIKRTVVKKHLRQHNLPVTTAKRLQCIRLTAFPVIEITYKVYLCGVRGKLAEHPVTFIILMHAIIDMIVYSFRQRTIYGIPLLKVKNHLVTPVDDVFIRKQPLVVVIDHLFLLCAHNPLFIRHPSSPKFPWHRADMHGKPR